MSNELKEKLKKKHGAKMENWVEYLTVYTDVCNPPYSCFWAGDARYLGKRWVDFTVPTLWLMEYLGITRVDDISVRLANFTLDKEAILVAAIEAGVVSYGW